MKELTDIEKASKAYPDLWDRWLITLYGYKPKNIVLSVEQADEFIALVSLPETPERPA